MRVIGILGGMSWESTALYYHAINTEVKSRLGGLHSAELVMYSLDFSVIEDLQHKGDWDGAGAIMAEAGRKLAALDEHCGRAHRDRSEITVTRQQAVCVAPTYDEAVAELEAMIVERGLSGADADAARARVIVGDPDTVGEAMSAQMELGIDGFTVSASANCHIPGRVELTGHTLARVVGI